MGSRPVTAWTTQLNAPARAMARRAGSTSRCIERQEADEQPMLAAKNRARHRPATVVVNSLGTRRRLVEEAGTCGTDAADWTSDLA